MTRVLTVARSIWAATLKEGYLPPALRMFVSVATPGVVLVATGHLDLLAFAASGAFPGMYGRGQTHRLRLVHQLQAAAVLLPAALLGMALSDYGVTPAVLVGVEALSAAACSAAAVTAAVLAELRV